MSEQDQEIQALLAGAHMKIEGATTTALRPDTTSAEATNAYDSVADAVNLATKAFMRAQGYSGLSQESAPALLHRVMTLLRRLRVKDVPSETDLTVMVFKRNSSVHDGVASITEVEQLKAVVELANSYLGIVEHFSRNVVH